MVLGLNRTAWGTKLLLKAVWASLVDCISSCHLLKAQHYSLSPNGALPRFQLPMLLRLAMSNYNQLMNVATHKHSYNII